jgi:hypothetical protein
MKNLTNLELLMEYMERNQYFIGNDLLAKYNELLKKEKQEQLTLTSVSNCISDEGLIEFYRLAYNDGFDNIGDKKDIIKHRQKQIAIIKKKYCC